MPPLTLWTRLILFRALDQHNEPVDFNPVLDYNTFIKADTMISENLKKRWLLGMLAIEDE